MAVTEVHNLSTGKVQVYTCTPEQAVMAAYAQSLNDWNTWDYGKRYGHLVKNAGHFVTCGDFTTQVR